MNCNEQAQDMLWDNIAQAIKFVENQRVLVKEIHIPESHRHLIPKDLTLPNIRIHIGGDKAYVASAFPYRIIKAKFELP